MAGNNERAEPARETTDAAVIRGEWITRARKVGDFASITTRTGTAIALDAHAARIACLVLGIEIAWKPTRGVRLADADADDVDPSELAADFDLLLRAHVLGVGPILILSPSLRDELARAVELAKAEP